MKKNKLNSFEKFLEKRRNEASLCIFHCQYGKGHGIVQATVKHDLLMEVFNMYQELKD